MKKLTLSLVSILFICLSGFTQSKEINNDYVYEYLKSQRSQLKFYEEPLTFHTESKDTLYLQKDSDFSLIIVEIWKTDEKIDEVTPYIVLHPNVELLVSKYGKKD